MPPFGSMFKSLKVQVTFFVSLLVVLQILIIYLSFRSFMQIRIENETSEKAKILSSTISKMPEIVNALRSKNTQIQEFIEDIRKDTDAEFIVVADRDGIRLTHPNRDMIGKVFVGGDYFDAVKLGKTYVSKSVGTLGPSLRAFSPVFYGDEIIGFVSVGYLETSIKNVFYNVQRMPIVFIFFMFLVGILIANSMASYIKRITLGLEPWEISSLHKEREIILNSVKEGIIAFDKSGKTRFINKEADRMIAGIKKTPEYVVKLIQENLEINGFPFIVNASSVHIGGRFVGVVSSFRLRDEIDFLKNEVARIRECSEVMRVQSHEYSNKLHTISGLLQLGEYEEAKNIILEESKNFHKFVDYLEKNISNSHISGLLMGKFNKAEELKCKLELDFEREGWISDPKNHSAVLTIVGNMIDNAIEAAKSKNQLGGVVFLSFYETATDFVFIAEDNGNGIQQGVNIFQKGYSTKGENRGIGMYNVKNAINKLNGKIFISSSSKLGGAKIEVNIPKGV